jgi:hypothetical protein
VSFLKRVLGGGEDPGPVPEWASFFTPRQYHEFDQEITDELALRGISAEFDEDRGSARITGGEWEGSRLGFVNLAQSCHQIPRRQWKSAIHEHFDRILKSVGPSDETDALDADFDAARAALRVRVYSAETEGMERSVTRPLTDGIVELLVYDLPDSAAGVLRENIAEWNRTDEELFAIGLENIKSGAKIEAIRLPGEGGAELFGIFGDNDIYTASHALFLEDYLPDDLELGAIVAIPNRHAVLYHPIVDAKAVGALSSIIPAAIGMFEQGPGSISPYVYWWQNGIFQRQPTEITEEGINFNPTEEFIYQVMNRIRPESA